MDGAYLAFSFLVALHMTYVCLVYYAIFVRQAALDSRWTLRRFHDLMPCDASTAIFLAIIGLAIVATHKGVGSSWLFLLVVLMSTYFKMS